MKTIDSAAFYPLLVLILGLLTYIPYLGSYGLLDPTDSFFLESGRELLEKNQFLLPLNNYVPWLDKPILFFWMVAYAYKFFGIHPFIGRLPAALSAVACGLIIYFGCRPMLKRSTATLAALIFLATPLASIIGHVCLTDMTLCALIAGSVLFLFKGLELKSKQDLLGGYIFLGFAMLCKGPIAIVLCGLALLPYLMSISRSKEEFWQKVLDLRPLLGSAIVLALNLPWYIMASLATNGQFLITFFYTQNFGRMVGAVNHQGPFWFYIPVFFGGFFPWWPLCLSAPGLFKKTLAKKFDEASRYRRFSRLCLFWFLTVIALFSAIKTKLPTYILPALPAFAILLAMQMELLIKTGKLRKVLPSTALITAAFIASIFIRAKLKGYVADMITQNLWIAAPVAVSLAAAWFGLFAKNAKLYLGALLVCSSLICGIMVPQGMKAFYNARQVGFGQLVCIARDAQASISMIFAEEPSVPWLTHKPVARLMNKEDAQRYLSEKAKPHYVLVQTSNLKRISEWFPGGSKEIDTRDKWHLVDVDSH